jgi:SAM-dependent methyltransferase
VSGYSARWRSVFGVVDPARTDADVRFLAVALPLPAFRRVLDVPCGDGRHLHALSALGYDVTGVDNDPAVAPPVLADLRELDSLPRGFDAAINMWQSFGYFDAAENEQVLGSFARRLRPGGRLVLDLQNRDFFEPRDPTERELRPGILSSVRGSRTAAPAWLRSSGSRRRPSRRCASSSSATSSRPLGGRADRRSG